MNQSRPLDRTLTLISFSRIALGFVFLIIFNSTDTETAQLAILFLIIAQATDNLDGWIARRYSTPNKKGYIQDSLADKMFNFAVLLSVSREYHLSEMIIWVIFFREVAVLSIRSIYSISHDRLLKLRIHSIFFAILSRFGLILIILSPIIRDFHMSLGGSIIDFGYISLYLSLIPASTGLYYTYSSAKASD